MSTTANVWPGKLELEAWLHNIAIGEGAGSETLRKLVITNPGFGAYLTEDADITGFIESFAVRFRAWFLETPKPIQPERMYKLLCEFVWRHIGLMLESLDKISSTGASLRSATGQLKMLLQTNEDLHQTLSVARRAYLKELTRHRDAQRTLSAPIQRVLAGLQEEPVMFYDPLNSFLDETTKEFVRSVIEERVKMESRNALIAPRMVDESVDAEISELNQQLEKLEQELKKAKVACLREAEAARRAQEAETHWKAEAEETRRVLTQHEGAGEDARLRYERELSQTKEREAAEARTRAQSEHAVDGDVVAQANSLKKEVEERDEIMRDMQREIDRLSAEIGAGDKKLQAEKAKVAATEEMRRSEAEMRKSLVDAQEEAAVEQDVVAKCKSTLKGGAAAPVEETIQVVDKIVVDVEALVEARQELEKHLEIERLLQEANEKLERALNEAEDRAIRSSMSGGGAAAGAEYLKGDAAKRDMETKEAIQKVKDLHKKELHEQAEEMERLRALLEKANNASSSEGFATFGEEKKKKKLVPEEHVDEGSSDKIMRWKMKYHESQETCEQLEHEKEVLEQKIRGLYARLKDLMSEDELEETLKTISLERPSPQKKKKVNAFDRLYIDAQRRIAEVRKKQEMLQKAQEGALRVAADKVKDSAGLQRISMLASLQKASVSSNQRFNSAMQNFNERSSNLAPVDEGGESTTEADGENYEVAKLPSSSGLCRLCGAGLLAVRPTVPMGVTVHTASSWRKTLEADGIRSFRRQQLERGRTLDADAIAGKTSTDEAATTRMSSAAAQCGQPVAGIGLFRSPSLSPTPRSTADPFECLSVKPLLSSETSRPPNLNNSAAALSSVNRGLLRGSASHVPAGVATRQLSRDGSPERDAHAPERDAHAPERDALTRSRSEGRGAYSDRSRSPGVPGRPAAAAATGCAASAGHQLAGGASGSTGSHGLGQAATTARGNRGDAAAPARAASPRAGGVGGGGAFETSDSPSSSSGSRKPRLYSERSLSPSSRADFGADAAAAIASRERATSGGGAFGVGEGVIHDLARTASSTWASPQAPSQPPRGLRIISSASPLSPTAPSPAQRKEFGRSATQMSFTVSIEKPVATWLARHVGMQPLSLKGSKSSPQRSMTGGLAEFASVGKGVGPAPGGPRGSLAELAASKSPCLTLPRITQPASVARQRLQTSSTQPSLHELRQTTSGKQRQDYLSLVQGQSCLSGRHREADGR